MDDDDGNEASKPKTQSGPVQRVQHEEYDQSPVADDTPVISTGDDTGEEPRKVPAKPPTPLQKKKLIKDLLDKQSKIPLKTTRDYEECCQVITGLAITDDNLDAIIGKITDLQYGNLDKE